MDKEFMFDIQNWTFWQATILDTNTEITQNVYSEQVGAPNEHGQHEIKVRTEVKRTQTVWLRFDNGKEQTLSFHSPVQVRAGHNVLIAGSRADKDSTLYEYRYMYVKDTDDMYIIEGIGYGEGGLFILASIFSVLAAIVAFFYCYYHGNPRSDSYWLVNISVTVIAFIGAAYLMGAINRIRYNSRAGEVRAYIFEYIRNNLCRKTIFDNLSK